MKDTMKTTPPKRVYLHIGFGKTGTTAIQTMMSENRDVFLTHGILYPDLGIYHHAHHKLAAIRKEPSSLEPVRDLLIRIRDDFLESAAKTLLISSEQLCFCRQELIEHYASVFAGFDSRIIFYARRQDQLIASTFLEWVKQGWDYGSGPEAFFRLHVESFDLHQRLAAWHAAFSDSQFIVHLYHPKLTRNVCEHFLKCIEFEGKLDELTMPEKANISLTPDFFPLMKLIDDLEPNRAARQTIIERLLGLSAVMKPQSEFKLINDALLEEIIRTYEDSNARFAEKYLNPKERQALMFAHRGQSDVGVNGLRESLTRYVMTMFSRRKGFLQRRR
jgi:hypothetical protein